MIARTCGKQYLGKTTQYMHNRHPGHRSEVENQSSELGDHFHQCGVNKMCLQIIDCVREGEDEALTILEGYWQNRLASFQANDGNLNVRNEWRHYVGQQPIFF